MTTIRRNSAYRKFFRGLILTSLALAVSIPVVGALAEDHKPWVGTWAASPQPTWDGDFPLPTLLPFNLWNQTVRQPVRISLGGSKVRIVLSNEYGDAPLTVDSVHVAMAAADGSIVEDTDQIVTFSGMEKVIIPAGAPMVSDAIAMNVPNRGDLAVTFYTSQPTPVSTFHWDALQTSYVAAGNQVSAPDLIEAQPTTVRMFLSDVLVEADEGARAVVAYGDSITDGAASGVDENARWPDFLAENLVGENVAVLNAGISGARLLQSKMGENSLARFDRDVLAQPNVKAVVVLMGINDIAWPGQVFAPDDLFPKKEELISVYRQLIARAHLRGVRVIVGTLTPFREALKGSPLEGYYTEKRDQLRIELNEWIRTSGEFDAVVDLDKLIGKADSPLDLQEDLQADYLHLSAKGNKMVADALTPEILFGNQ